MLKPFVFRLLFALGLSGLVAVPLSAVVVSYTFSGVTTTHFTYLTSFDNEFTVGTPWSATVVWDSSSTAQFSSSTQGQYRLTDFSFTLQGNSGAWSTSALQTTYAPSFTLNYQGADLIQFTSGFGPNVHTNNSLFGFTIHSVNLILKDPTATALDDLSNPTFIDYSEWSHLVNDSQLKIYLNNDANRYILGQIDSVIVTGSNPGGSVIPEPSTYAALAGLGALGWVMWQRRRQPATASVTLAG